ncbi:MAG: helix-turn-helix transcriptional regulator [Bacteroidota bacterium]|nr:helix-turn-helix transcriptional regulator [Bacteroidota bacterium]
MAAVSKKALQTIPSFELDTNYLFVHKEALAESNFGCDNTNELIGGGFGLYSSVKVKEKIGPLKSQFYRIGFCRRGSLQVDCGLETFVHHPNSIHFNFPNQLFSLQNKSEDMYSWYILFSQDFADELLPAASMESQFPFFDYAGVPFFDLSTEEAELMANQFLAIDSEIRADLPDKTRAIKLILNLILITAKRSYIRQGLQSAYHNQRDSSLVIRFKKLVAQHFISVRSVATYASQLAVSSKHLGKVIKQETGKNASDFIDDMLMMEIKALLRHSMLSISEIAYQLDFSDPSHLTKFFKKKDGRTPLAYRNAATVQ